MTVRFAMTWTCRAALVVLLALGTLIPGASAQDARLEAAKKEGKVVWYTSLALPSAEKVAKLFETAYPGIKVEVNRTGSERIIARVMQELKANIKNVDVVHTSDAGHFVYFKAQKLLTKYTPAGVEAFPAGFKDKDGYFYGLRATVNVIAYNTKTVSAAEAPKTWKDLLDPRWKGKMVTAHPGYSGVISTHVLALVNQYGWDYFKQLAQNKLMLVQSAVDPSGVVASGERPVAVDGGEYTFYQIKKKGNPVEIVYPKEGVPLVVSPTAIMSFAPHPTAARLFTDFTFSREVQQVMADSEGLYTGHPEVKYPADKPKLTDLKLLTVDPEELEKRGEEIRQRFVEFFGA
jgi:iron(III) transport system substrate-binding protein